MEEKNFDIIATYKKKSKQNKKDKKKYETNENCVEKTIQIGMLLILLFGLILFGSIFYYAIPEITNEYYNYTMTIQNIHCNQIYMEELKSNDNVLLTSTCALVFDKMEWKDLGYFANKIKKGKINETDICTNHVDEYDNVWCVYDVCEKNCLYQKIVDIKMNRNETCVFNINDKIYVNDNINKDFDIRDNVDCICNVINDLV